MSNSGSPTFCIKTGELQCWLRFCFLFVCFFFIQSVIIEYLHVSHVKGLCSHGAYWHNFDQRLKEFNLPSDLGSKEGLLTPPLNWTLYRTAETSPLKLYLNKAVGKMPGLWTFCLQWPRCLLRTGEGSKCSDLHRREASRIGKRRYSSFRRYHILCSHSRML